MSSNTTGFLNGFAKHENDNEEIAFSKKLILIIALSCSLCGIVWSGLYYYFLGFSLTAILPLVFVVFVGLAIPFAHIAKNHLILVNAQLISIVWITAFIQWNIGSLHDSSIVIAWGLLGPIGALLFLNKKASVFWLLQYICIIAITILIEPKLSNDSIHITESFRQLFYLMNLIVPAVVVFGTAYYFVSDLINQKNLNQQLLEETEYKKQEILDSIAYAKRIQNAIMPTENKIKDCIPDGFVFYQPKDIVAGDFYWMEKVTIGMGNDAKESLLVAACDCTGHGVPGAMVSVICNNALKRSLTEHGLSSTGRILDQSRALVMKEFEKSEEMVKDGMDIALVNINEETLSFSGANNPIWIIRKNENTVEEIKGCKQPIGYTVNPTPFVTHETKISKGDCIYVFTDGLIDQFGGPKGKKFKSPAFKNLLLSIYKKPMAEQKTLIAKALKNWMGNLEQVDDICVIGIRV